MSFCRDAPPEFNDHQRDVFCVFSGHGVSRLRDHLNDSKHFAHENRGRHAPNFDVNAGLMGMDDADDTNVDSESGTNTPVMNVNVAGNHAPGATPVAPGPATGHPTAPFHQAMLNNNPWAPQNFTSSNLHGNGQHLALSQSAPAATGQLWAGNGNTPTHLQGHNLPPPPPLLAHGHGHGHGNAQQVTGMMGATVLDDVDEGDETFGDESELMND